MGRRLVVASALWALFTALPALGATVRVPQDVRDLATALRGARDGDVIELAPGTYPSPPKAFSITTRRTFTVRAATPGTAVLDGGGSRQILRVVGTGSGTLPDVAFEGIVFRHGGGGVRGGAVLLTNAVATFRDCRFEDNVGSRTAALSPPTGRGW